MATKDIEKTFKNLFEEIVKIIKKLLKELWDCYEKSAYLEWPYGALAY